MASLAASHLRAISAGMRSTKEWFGNTRCYVYTGRQVESAHAVSSARQLVEKDREVKRPKAHSAHTPCLPQRDTHACLWIDLGKRRALSPLARCRLEFVSRLAWDLLMWPTLPQAVRERFHT